jgi:hypothetical protein
MDYCFCDWCGSKVFDGDRCCPACGGPIKNTSINVFAKKDNSSFDTNPLKGHGFSEKYFTDLAEQVMRWNGNMDTFILCGSISDLIYFSDSKLFRFVNGDPWYSLFKIYFNNNEYEHLQINTGNRDKAIYIISRNNSSIGKTIGQLLL